MSKMTNDPQTDSLNRALALCGVTVDRSQYTARIEMVEYDGYQRTMRFLVPAIVYACDAGFAWRFAIIVQPGPRASIWKRTPDSEGVKHINDDTIRMDWTVPKTATHPGQVSQYTARKFNRLHTYGIATGRWDDPEMDITGPRWLHVYGPGLPGVILPKMQIAEVK